MATSTYSDKKQNTQYGTGDNQPRIGTSAGAEGYLTGSALANARAAGGTGSSAGNAKAASAGSGYGGSGYSFNDVLSAMEGAGLTRDNFSSYDWSLAQQYPEFGLSLVSLKNDYGSAKTDAQRLLANEAANELRKSYGGYGGGSDGLGYYAESKNAAETRALDSQINDVLGQIGSYGPFNYRNDDAYQRALDSVANAAPFSYDATAPVYNNAYAQMQQELLDAALNRPDFAWSKETDPLWSGYKKSYLREGDRATANALGQASAASGGRASSYAASAATQAGDYYAAKLGDIIPTLYQQAYDRYLQDYQMKLSDLNAVNTQEQLDYNRYLTDLGQFNTDRNFALNQYEIENAQRLNALNALLSDRSQEYNEYLGQYDMLQNYLGDLTNRNGTMYSRTLDEAARQRQAEQDALAKAQLAAQLGDYSLIQSQGISPDLPEMANMYGGTAEDGSAYGIGSQRGIAFIENAGAGAVMNESDGSIWVKNADGTTTITDAGGKTYTVANPNAYTSPLEQMQRDGVADQNTAYLWMIDHGYSAQEALEQSVLFMSSLNGDAGQYAYPYGSNIYGTGGSGGGNGGSGGGNGGNGNLTDDQQAAINAFKAGDQSDATIQALLAAGYTEQEIRAAGYTGNYFGVQGTAQLAKDTVQSFGGLDVPDSAVKALLDAGATEQEIKAAGYTGGYFNQTSSTAGSNSRIRNQNGDGWIHVAGGGRMTYTEVLNGVNNGTIKETQNADGTYSYRVTNNRK